VIYTLGDADVGATMRVVVSYTDGHGRAETVKSAASAAVANVNDAPTDILLSAASVTEGSLTGSVVGTLTTLDPDGGATYTYALLDDAGGRANR
jgi:hypothetical protein